jgi:hypothetical protein
MVLALLKQVREVNARLLAQDLFKKSDEELTKSNIDSARNRLNNLDARLRKWERGGNEDAGKDGMATTSKKGKAGGVGVQGKGKTSKRRRGDDDDDDDVAVPAGKKVKKAGAKVQKTLVKHEGSDGDADAGDETEEAEEN